MAPWFDKDPDLTPRGFRWAEEVGPTGVFGVFGVPGVAGPVENRGLGGSALMLWYCEERYFRKDGMWRLRVGLPLFEDTPVLGGVACAESPLPVLSL